VPVVTTELDPSARYVIVDEIASGGMGSVFLALHSDEDGKTMPVAIKKLHAHLAEDFATVDAFVDEARIAYRLRHPNVVRVHDVVPIDGQLVIVMDWVEGVAMRSLGRAKEDKLPIPVIRRMLVDTLEGLHAAHQLKDDRGAKLDVVHRDISPQNLLVGTDGLTRVTDFGIALARGRLAPTTVQGGVKGKIPYLSPEQVNRSKIDHRSDIFAAGVVAWEMLTGKRLFVAPSEGEIMAMILREPIQPPSASRMDVPLDLDETILKALERNPERRFATAADFARAIAQGGPMASHEEVGRIVATTAGSSLAARRQKLALAAERKTAARPLREEMTATFVHPVPAPGSSVRPSRVVIEPVSIMTPVVDPTGVATSLPPMQAMAGRSTTPLLLAVVLALGLAIVIVIVV
jgi:serine/threonine-protein kinase